MTLRIRPAETGDVPGIFHVRTSVSENLLSMDELAERGITPSAIARMIAAEPCAWVADLSGTVVGFSMIDTAEASLFAAFVLPSHAGKGIGRQLVTVAEARLLALHPVCWLETGKATRAAGFYRSMGWGHETDLGGGNIRLEKHRI